MRLIRLPWCRTATSARARQLRTLHLTKQRYTFLKKSQERQNYKIFTEPENTPKSGTSENQGTLIGYVYVGIIFHASFIPVYFGPREVGGHTDEAFLALAYAASASPAISVLDLSKNFLNKDGTQTPPPYLVRTTGVLLRLRTTILQNRYSQRSIYGGNS